MPPAPSQTPNRLSPLRAAAIASLGWLVPGAGFLLIDRRHRRRGLLLAVTIHVTFVIGMLLRGGVEWPIWDSDHAGFSIVNNLTFVVRMAAGWLSVLSLAATQLDWPAIGGIPEGAYFELGGFYCFVAGALNYFTICQSLDLAVRKPFERLTER